MLWQYSGSVKEFQRSVYFQESNIGSNGLLGGQRCSCGLLSVSVICLSVLAYLLKRHRAMRQNKLIINKLLDCNYPIETAKYAVAVSAFETSNWTSRIYQRNHNLFGMKLPQLRKTTAIGENYKHAKYKSNEQSVFDFVYYLDHFNYPRYFNSLFHFVSYMKSKGYFEASLSDYYTGVQIMYRKYFKSTG
ncbi:hypothetical protein ES705_25240 [subsurface metagenome]